jgi:hypothetical protein
VGRGCCAYNTKPYEVRNTQFDTTSTRYSLSTLNRTSYIPFPKQFIPPLWRDRQFPSTLRDSTCSTHPSIPSRSHFRLIPSFPRQHDNSTQLNSTQRNATQRYGMQRNATTQGRDGNHSVSARFVYSRTICFTQNPESLKDKPDSFRIALLVLVLTPTRVNPCLPRRLLE